MTGSRGRRRETRDRFRPTNGRQQGGRIRAYGLNDAEDVGRGVVGRVAAVPAIKVVAEERRHAHVAGAMRGKVVGLEVGFFGVTGARRVAVADAERSEEHDTWHTEGRRRAKRRRESRCWSWSPRRRDRREGRRLGESRGEHGAAI